MATGVHKKYVLGDFALEPDKRLLTRAGAPVRLAHRPYQVLLYLIENRDRIVTRQELLERFWEGHDVYEVALSKCVGAIRKSLNDQLEHPRFIETRWAEGYRYVGPMEEQLLANGASFIEIERTRGLRIVIEEDSQDFPAESEKVVVTAELETAAPPTPAAATRPASIARRYLAWSSVGVVLLGSLAAAGFVGNRYVGGKTNELTAPILSAPFASEKLSTNGKVFNAAISPDGKNVVFTNGIEGKQSVWLRQLDTGNNVEIIPPSDDFYFRLALSPDGNFLYFTRAPKGFVGQAAVYRVSIFGGVPNRVVNETQGGFSISPDGAKISFVRCYYRDDEYCSLWIADAADGKTERKLAAHPSPIRIADNEISPDGKRVAFAVGQSRNYANEFGLSEIEIESGAERELTAEKFFNIKSLAWLPDQSSLLITASKIPTKHFRIWHIAAASGEAVPLTKDSESYSALSLDKEASRLISTQVKEDFRLKLWQTENSFAAPQILANASSAVFAPDGKIIFTSPMTGNDEIWSVNADSSGQRQLTNNPADDRRPIVSPDGNSIFFASNRTGAAHVWRMNADGSNQEQITKTEGGGYPLSVSPDGRWLFYQHGVNRTLWRAAAKGGEERVILDKAKIHFAVSPDGSQTAFSEKQGEENILTIISLANGQTVKTYKFADGKAVLVDLEWSQDGENLAYILAEGEFGNKILWFQPLNGETPLRIADLGDERIAEVFGLALSSYGKSFTVAQGSWRHDAVLLKGLR